MAQFEGFRDGCPGEVWLGERPYIHTVVNFQADGKVLSAVDAGVQEPDAIRIIAVDDYMSSTYRDRVLAFNEGAAEEQVARGDSTVPERNIRLIREEQLHRLSELCQSCQSGEACPILSAAVQAYEDAPVPMTHKEAYVAELAYFLREIGDSSAGFFRIHRPAPPELSEEDLEDILATATEMGLNASIEPIEKDGEIVLGIKIVGGQHHQQPE